MKKISFFILTIFLSVSIFAQSTEFAISGKVIDAATKTPLQLASVFAQNTTSGTATDAEGKFILRLANGGYDLIITYTGYETFTRRITTADADDKNLTIELKVKDKALEDVVIKSSSEVKDGWLVYGDFFMDNFIGKTANSVQCTIKNKDAVKFYFSKRKNRLKVMATEPLEIINASLGYKIKYTLDSFTHEYSTQVSTYTGYPLFEELPTTDEIQKQLWSSKRKTAYKGSILHFMRSLYNKTLQQEGFEMQFIVKNNNTDTAILLKDYYGAVNYDLDDTTKVLNINFNQPDVAILYTKETPEIDYLTLNPETNPAFQTSVITVPANVSIGIEQNGYYYDQNDITISGYWTWEKVADMLPYDYKPD